MIIIRYYHSMDGEITILVFSSLLKRERKIYAFDDLKFLVPLSLKLTGNIVLCLLIWALPMIMIFKFSVISNQFLLFTTFGVPIALALFISKPNAVFNNKNFYSWLLCNMKYMISSRYITDGKASGITNGDTMGLDSVIWLGDDNSVTGE